MLNYVALLNDRREHEKALLLLERLFSSTNHSLSDAPGALSSLASASTLASASGPAVPSTAPHADHLSSGAWWPAAQEAAENHMLLDMHMALAHTMHRGNVSDEAESLYREILSEFPQQVPAVEGLAALLAVRLPPVLASCPNACCSRSVGAASQGPHTDARTRFRGKRINSCPSCVLPMQGRDSMR